MNVTYMNGYGTEILYDYLNKNFITLLILATIIVMAFTNRKNKITGTGLIAIPLIIDMIVTGLDIFGLGLVYSF